MPAADRAGPIQDDELTTLFADFQPYEGIVLAVSGGPDSTALMLLAQRWRARRERGPRLMVASVDHGLRAESAAEARQVAELSARLGLPHAVLEWRATKPRTGLQAAARTARHALLHAFARNQAADAIAFAHTCEDQAETVLMRLGRGSGLSGLRAMRPVLQVGDVSVLRPLLQVPKHRLVATVEAAGLGYAQDPSNRDERFARPRLRRLAGDLAREGLDGARLSLFARRVARADEALEAMVRRASAEVSAGPWESGVVVLDPARLFALPAEISLRLLILALSACASEGPVQLGKAEALHAALCAAGARGRVRRTLAGALVTLQDGGLKVTRAPARRIRAG